MCVRLQNCKNLTHGKYLELDLGYTGENRGWHWINLRRLGFVYGDAKPIEDEINV